MRTGAAKPDDSEQVTASKGPPVWLGMDQNELDAAYDQNIWAPNRLQVNHRRNAVSRVVIERLGPPTRVAYGPSEKEKLDIYPAPASKAPVHIFIHGGAWRGGSAKDYALPAEMFNAAGVHYIAADFASVEETGGSLKLMAEQVRRAVAWTYQNAASFGGEPDRLYLSGHSSGAHLAAVALVTDWPREFGLPAEIIKAGLLISGMYDLKPVRLSARRLYVNFDDETEELLSPQRHIERLRAPLTIAYGTVESPEFQRQSRDFAAAVKAAGKPAELIVGEGYNHFEIYETIGNPFALAGRAALKQMGMSLGPRARAG
jgi:arylformamidase